MLIGYARTSTVEQTASFDAQKVALVAQGCTKVFSEQTSSVGDREELDKALEFVREGDTLMVTKLDRLARSVSHLCQLVERLQNKGVSLRVLDMGLDTGTPTGRLMLNLLGAIGQFEREVMLERQRVGIAKAKVEGKYRGRKPTAQQQSGQVLELRGAGVGASAIAERLGISRASVYRIVDAEDCASRSSVDARG